ncbi:MAG: hypothetical protein ACRD1L_03360 [Terriglobales bacterium]
MPDEIAQRLERACRLVKSARGGDPEARADLARLAREQPGWYDGRVTGDWDLWQAAKNGHLLAIEAITRPKGTPPPEWLRPSSASPSAAPPPPSSGSGIAPPRQ